MNKNKFAGLTEAKMKSLEGETAPENEEKPVKTARKAKKKQGSNKAIKQARKKTGSLENIVGVTIKIPEEKRIWWNVQAKMQRTTVTDAIIEALDKRFGEPNF
jgi:hypothetical protein